ncbi:MAG: hypothetical protein KGS72_15305 [Cyanobacteria bacterium REEB67]|nr:hypothetical protein [Cyanobacteria bacterium REEB67]
MNRNRNSNGTAHRAVGLSILTICNLLGPTGAGAFLNLTLASAPAIAGGSHLRLQRQVNADENSARISAESGALNTAGSELAPPGSTSAIIDKTTGALQGGVAVEHQLGYTVAVVQTWPGGAPPTVPTELAKQPPTITSAKAPKKAGIVEHATALQAMDGKIDPPSGHQANSSDAGVPQMQPPKQIEAPGEDIIAAFPDQAAGIYPGHTIDVPGTTKTTTTTTHTSESASSVNNDWNRATASSQSSSKDRWSSNQGTKASAHHFGAGFSFRGMMGAYLPRIGMPHLTMPTLAWPGLGIGGLGLGNLASGLPGFGMGFQGAGGLSAMWSSFKAMKKNKGSTSSRNRSDSSQTTGNSSSTDTIKTTDKTTTTTETTPGYTVNVPGQAPPDKQVDVPAMTAQAAPEPLGKPEGTSANLAVQPAALAAIPEHIDKSGTPQAVSSLPAATEHSSKKIDAKPLLTLQTAPPALVVVPWTNWYRRMAASAYQNWSKSKPLPGEALVAVSVTDAQQISVSFLPHTNGGTAMTDAEIASFNTTIQAAMNKLTGNKQIAFPPQSHRKKVAFILGFSAEEGGVSGCGEMNICDREQYYVSSPDCRQVQPKPIEQKNLVSHAQ